MRASLRNFPIITLIVPFWFGSHAYADEPALMPAGVKLQHTVIGRVYADANDRTLYVLDRERVSHGAAFQSSCLQKCLETWKPFPAAALARDSGDWSVARRNDGTLQWVYKGRPLYTYAGDSEAGQLGPYENEVLHWQAVIHEPAFLPKQVKLQHTVDGWAFVTATGRSLYCLERPGIGGARDGSTQPKVEVCDAECLNSWNALPGKSDTSIGGNWSLIKRSNGMLQWAYDGKAVYTYTEDKKSGDASGDILQYHTGGRAYSWRVLRPL
jgi:predicted lipoprotein with Yx(FWY)xxD motif